MKRGTGYLKSILDGSELDFDKILDKKSLQIPDTFNYSKTCEPLMTIKNQGSTSMCVAYSLSYMIETLEFLHNNNSSFKLDKDRVYSIRSNKGEDGMQPKEALEYIKSEGMILKYGKLKNISAIQKALICNGPCMFALPCYDDCEKEEFWKGEKRCGGHAICCVGWTEDGFILENSWGKSWGNGGKLILPWKDTSKILEAWTILK